MEELYNIKMIGSYIPWALSTIKRFSNHSMKILALLNLFGAPVTRAPSIESAARSDMSRQNAMEIYEGKYNETGRTHGRHHGHVKIGLDLLRLHD